MYFTDGNCLNISGEARKGVWTHLTKANMPDWTIIIELLYVDNCFDLINIYKICDLDGINVNKTFNLCCGTVIQYYTYNNF